MTHKVPKDGLGLEQVRESKLIIQNCIICNVQNVISQCPDVPPFLVDLMKRCWDNYPEVMNNIFIVKLRFI